MQENQRIRLSKQLLRDSLTDLLNEKSIHKISVREICDKAQINRTTFYKYYGSQYDVLRDIENEVLARVDEYLDTDDISVDNNLQRLAGLMAFVDDNISLCRILFNNNVDPEFPEKLLNLPSIRNLVTAHLQTYEYSDSELEYILSLVTNGGFSVIKSWMNKRNRETPEVIAALLGKTIIKLFPAYME